MGILCSCRLTIFTVQAKQSYHASGSEDLELLKGDIVAVTMMRKDGWAIGEPVDKARRQPGKHLLSSKFVCLLPN